MPNNAILDQMLDRLYGSMLSGASMNCRPHASRQRIDLTLLERLEDVSATALFKRLMGAERSGTVEARVPVPADFAGVDRLRVPSADDESPHAEDDAAHRRFRQQRTVLTKLRNLSDEARTYEQDTGVTALNIGYPILCLPPGAMTGNTARVLAPIAFIPVTLTVRTGRKPGVEIACRGDGIERVVPNAALLAWIERQTGRNAGDLFVDEEGGDPLREIASLIDHVVKSLELTGDVAASVAGYTDAGSLAISAVARMDDLPRQPAILPSAVIGLFPSANQALLRDTRMMIEQPELDGPVRSFIDVQSALQPSAAAAQDVMPDVSRRQRAFTEERLVAQADPFQVHAVGKARNSRGLVIHGPPGTGKSQTITNIIGDHLFRGERVLFVCDKRTALDVVFNRLAHLGLGGLCAIVHDPQRDQRNLYMAIRGQLEALPENKTRASAERELSAIDHELQKLHDDLTAHHAALMTPRGDEPSFHDLIGQWLTISAAYASAVDAEPLAGVTLEQLDEHRQTIEMALERGLQSQYAENPWVACAGLTLDEYLIQPSESWRARLASCAEEARVADATRHTKIPPFDSAVSLSQQALARTQIADALQAAVDGAPAETRGRCAEWDGPTVRLRTSELNDLQPQLELARRIPLDAELLILSGDLNLRISEVVQSMGVLDAYIQSVSTWHGFIQIGVRSAGKKLLRRFGVPTGLESAQHLRRFFQGWRARTLLSEQLRSMDPLTAPGLVADGLLIAGIEQHQVALAALSNHAGAESLSPMVREALKAGASASELIDGLRRSADRAAALERLEILLHDSGLFTADWLKAASGLLRVGKAAGESLSRLTDRFDSLETILRLREDLQRLPEAMRSTVRRLLAESATVEDGWLAIRRGVLAGRITRRLADDPLLRQFDGQRLENSFRRCGDLESQKLQVVRDAILHRWRTRQRERLLVGTGTRVNSDGARLRQRLFVRGHRAMRLRQVIAVGQQHEGGDPLFDLCPVWMASPETVAQIFAMEPLFDVVVFDEASQCRLEEALPVLMRAKRVVIAGDPKQLPPSRFFESAVTVSDDGPIESDQDLFEAQQTEIEDLLASGLNLEIEEAYLDVHYRSRNADLIEFSNQQFYGSRLQAIPGHPANRTRFAPITLHRVQGVYEERCNPLEARQVCRIVHDLLRRAEPPSIGIATFNLTQRDLIVEMLDELAVEDEGFGARLAAARSRVGDGSFEGLFVKNLENVQGDERDHIIISTTYGPTSEGKFYRRFGPLGMAGGGRRLNVLVTRARQEVHLVTSIPPEVYRALPPLPEGAVPNGGWLLFAYLQYAEQLAGMYEQNHRVLSDEQNVREVAVNQVEIPPLCAMAMGVGQILCGQHDIGSDVHWGNEGFRIDVALHHPRRLDDVTVGLLCDFAQFQNAADPVQWDAFRTMIHQSQGWTLHRVWSPQFFRDQTRSINQVIKEAERIVHTEAKQPPVG